MRGLRTGIRATISLAVVAGCGGSGSQPREDAGQAYDARIADGADHADGDDGASRDAGPRGESIVVTVTRGVLTEVFAPAEGAVVALDAPGGHRSEGVTDAAGRVVFDGIDWSFGTADVTSYVEGEPLVSIVGVDHSSEIDVVHQNALAVSHREVTLSGTLRNREAGAVTTVVTELSSLATWPTGDAYTLRVRAGVPLTLVVVQATSPMMTSGDEAELFWTVVRHDALLDDTTLDLDLSRREEPERVSGSIGVPSGLEDASWTVGVTPGNGFVGVSSRVQASAGVVEYDMELLRLLPEEDVLFAATGTVPFGNGAFTFARRSGYPRAGRVDPGFLEIPALETPMRGTSVGLHDVVRWRGRATELRITRGTRGVDPFIWRIALPEGSTEVVVPRPPSGVDVEAVLGTEPLAGILWSIADTADGWNLIAASRYFELVP